MLLQLNTADTSAEASDACFCRLAVYFTAIPITRIMSIDKVARPKRLSELIVTMSMAAKDPPCDRAGDLLGVLGGMGPAATADFLGKLARLNPARTDQDHIRSVTCSFSDTPDRAQAILERGPSPLPAMLRALWILERCGAAFIAIPCNTAHYWFDELQEQASVPLLHIVDAVHAAMLAEGRLNAPLGLLGTTATVRAGVYQRRLGEYGIDCITPDESGQSKVMDVIRRVKGGRIVDEDVVAVECVAAALKRRGASAVVLACTELPLLVPSRNDVVDSTAALARQCLRVWQLSVGACRKE